MFVKFTYNSDISKVIILLTKLRFFSMILNDCDDKIRGFLEAELAGI